MSEKKVTCNENERLQCGGWQMRLDTEAEARSLTQHC